MLSELKQSLGEGELGREQSSFTPVPPQRDFRKMRVDYQCTAKLQEQERCTKFQLNGMGECGFFDLETKSCYCITNGVS